METDGGKKANGTIIKVPDLTPGLIFTDGRQRAFKVERIWNSPIAPALNQVVEIEFDGAGEISSVKIGRIEVPKEEISPAPASPVAVPVGNPAVPAAGAPSPAMASPAAAPDDIDRNTGTVIAVVAGIILLTALIAVGFEHSSRTSSRSYREERSSYTSSSTPRETKKTVEVEEPPPPAPAPDPEAIVHVRRFVEKRKIASNVVTTFLHAGTSFDGQTFQGVGPLNGGVPGFAVFYRYQWDSDGWTDVAYICTPAGLISRLQVMKTNASASKPFVMARLAGAVIAAVLHDAVKDDTKLTQEEKAQLQTLIDSVDVEKMLDFYLMVEQRTE